MLGGFAPDDPRFYGAGMDQDKKKRIAVLIDELESLAPPDGKVRIDVYGGGIDESYLRGNESGLLRMGVGIIRAAIAPYKDAASKFTPNAVTTDIEGVFHEESDISIDWIERTDDLTSETPLTAAVRRRSRRDWLWIFVTIIIGLGIVLLWHTLT